MVKDMNIHEDIKKLLNDGKIVYSFALGRVGQIIDVHPHPSGFVVEVCPKGRTWNPVTRHNHQHGVTTFLIGDPVELHKKEDAAGKEIWVVQNTFEERK